MDMTHTLTAANGRTFTARVVFPGEGYGRGRVVVNGAESYLTRHVAPSEAKIMVEMYDAKYAGVEGFEPEGQIVGQWNLDTILTHDAASGWSLYGGEPVWSMDRDSCKALREALESLTGVTIASAWDRKDADDARMREMIARTMG